MKRIIIRIVSIIGFVIFGLITLFSGNAAISCFSSDIGAAIIGSVFTLISLSLLSLSIFGIIMTRKKKQISPYSHTTQLPLENPKQTVDPLTIPIPNTNITTAKQTIERIKDEVNEINLQNAKEMKTDLVEADYFNGCCEECAKYRGRWFSISGKDKRFHKMPVNYPCTCQGISFYPVIFGISEPSYCPKNTNIVEYSNRPFVDDRTSEEKRIHQFFLDRKIYEEINERDRKNYQLIVHLLPQIAPKSMSAYSRMRNNNTQQFQDLALKAKEIGVDILLSNEEQTSIKRYLNTKKETGWK